MLHFLLLGIVLFAAYAYVQRGRGGVESSKQIAVSLDDLRTMDLYFESQWHRPPTPAEFQAMVEDKVREEVLYREGLAMGLDKDDEIVKRRMAQKMQFLAEDVATAHEPSTAELKAWFDKNSGKFALPSRYSFRHLYFSPDKRGKNAQADAAAALTKIAGQPEDSKLAAASGDSFMFQDYYGDRTPEAIAKEFGPQFAIALEKLKPGSWQGPVESGYGWHLVFVDTVIPGSHPGLRRDGTGRKDRLARRTKATSLAEGIQRHARQVHSTAPESRGSATGKYAAKTEAGSGSIRGDAAAMIRSAATISSAIGQVQLQTGRATDGVELRFSAAFWSVATREPGFNPAAPFLAEPGE